MEVVRTVNPSQKIDQKHFGVSPRLVACASQLGGGWCVVGTFL